MRARLLFAVALVLFGAGVIAGITSAQGGARRRPAAGASPASAARKALALWARFPANANPRPIVDAGEGSINFPASGFATGDAKLAYLEGRVWVGARLPTALASVDGYRLISAAAAVAQLRVGTHPQPGPRLPALVVTGARLASGVFRTDRGREPLPAWVLRVTGVRGPVQVLAVATPQRWPEPTTRELTQQGLRDSAEESVIEAPTSLELSINFVGGPAGHRPCDVSYTATAYTSAHAVAIVVAARPVPLSVAHNGRQPVACSLVGYGRSASVRLGSPLGGRVVIAGDNGAALPVSRARALADA
jgi:hypothetical protein